MNDHERKIIIEQGLKAIEKSIRTVHILIDEGLITHHESIKLTLEAMTRQASKTVLLGWPDSEVKWAQATQAAKQDQTLQKLIRRASKPTPIRSK
jgi:hypothetical protein